MTSTYLLSKIKTGNALSTLLQVVLGSFFIMLLSQFSVPLQPVPMTLQTLTVFLLAMQLGGQKAAYAFLLYLGEASAGLPVLAGWRSDPLWILTPTAGYLLGFPIAAFVVGSLLELRAQATWMWTILAVCIGQLVIYCFGLSGLLFFLDWGKAWSVGILPFVPATFYKMSTAVALYMASSRLKTFPVKISPKGR